MDGNVTAFRADSKIMPTMREFHAFTNSDLIRVKPDTRAKKRIRHGRNDRFSGRIDTLARGAFDIAAVKPNHIRTDRIKRLTTRTPKR